MSADAVNVLILKAGTAAAELRSRIGDYESWFVQSMQGLPVAVTVVESYQGERPPAGRRFGAIIMTGSPLSVLRPEGWMAPAADYMIEAAQGGTAVLGVCFGHQLLARALGGAVARNPLGREIGTIACQLTEAGQQDAVLGGWGPSPTFQATHEDAVTELPPRAVLLGSNSKGIQAFAYGKSIRGVQFHPELSQAGMRQLIESRRAKLEGEGLYEGAARSIAEAPAGPALLKAFLRLTPASSSGQSLA